MADKATTLSEKAIPISRKPCIYFKFNDPEIKLEFVKWTIKYLVVRYPTGSKKAGQEWKMGRNLVNSWLKSGVLRIEGEIPELALVE